MMTTELLATFVDSYAMLLRTRRRNGTWVGTPGNVAVEGDHAFFRTFESSGKAKRIRNFPDVSVAPCTAGPADRTLRRGAGDAPAWRQ